jgi:hypothetical protein
MSEPYKACAECGAELADDAVRGLCPRCLLQVGMGSQTDSNATVADAGGARRQRAMPQIGGRFGPYRILRLLGRGGMGVVYEAEEHDTGRRIALKVLGRQFDSPTDRARFLREGRLAASINHPNSVYVFGTDEIDGTPTIAMELVAGGTLQERIKNQGPMPVPVAVDAILQIIAGLEAAQAIGILHRDVKPGNCFEDADGAIKIGDFGLSISSAARAEAIITATGTAVGTPAFCSPEQLRGDELNVRSDMYSVGVTLFYLLTGRVPFEGHNIAQLTANVLEKPSPSPRDYRKDIPKGLAGVILRCLAKQPTDRFKSYHDLRRALTPYTSTAPTPATLSLRFLAGMLDMWSLSIIGTLAMWLALGNPWGFMFSLAERWPVTLAMVSTGFVLAMGYYGFFEGIWGAGIGKAVCRLRVVGPNRTPPGFFSAFLRALLFVALPPLPFWFIFGFVYGADNRAYMSASAVTQYMIGISFYVVLALLFCTARRRNGFAAVHDLVTKTRVISRTALEWRPIVSAVETPPANVDSRPTIGPYQVLETLEAGAEGQWVLGYDLRLLRKVWIHTVPPNTPPVPALLRNIGRIGRLRWLTGRRTPEENWDAFEGASGQPLLRLARDRQPWSQVRFWLYDLAREIGAAEKDGTLPLVLDLDRVWITGDGRAKLLDFRAPGLAGDGLPEADAKISPLRAPTEGCSGEGTTGAPQRFLGKVAVAALEGRTDLAATPSTEPAVPVPIHARDLLKNLPRFSQGDAVAKAIQPLLRRTSSISRWRRAAVVAGCILFPVLMSSFMVLAMDMVQRSCPGLMDLQMLLQGQQAKSWTAEKTDTAGMPGQMHREAITDRQFAIYIASHYRTLITDDASWNSPMVLSLIKGDARRFAEQSVAEHPAPTEQEIADADAALEPHLSQFRTAAMPRPIIMTAILLAVYVCLPALIAALLFRSGLLLRMAGIAFVRWDGKRASRLRVLWRALVAWGPLLLVPIGLTLLRGDPDPTVFSGMPLVLYLCCGLFGALAVLSVALPQRGLPDRLAGTWPVPR